MVIETTGLTKYYGKKLGCKDISLEVGKGEIFGYLGPNGAGKSTLVKMLTGLIFPTEGKALILGKPLGDVRARKKVGYLPELFKYQDWMTGKDLLSFHGSLFKLEKKTMAARMEEVLELVKMKGQEKYKVGTYSKGMQQRMGMACALLPDPDLLILDEPTSALDPIGRKHVREMMLELRRRGKTVFLNSHLLSEVEMVCDSVAIVKNGTVIKQGKMEEILKSETLLEIQGENLNEMAMRQLKDLVGTGLEQRDGRITVAVKDKEEIHAIASIIIQNGGKLYSLVPHRRSLEEVFINLIESREV